MLFQPDVVKVTGRYRHLTAS